MGKVSELLQQGKAHYPEFDIVFEHAAVLAREAEYRAAHTSDLAMTAVEPKYEPLVQLLADVIGDKTDD